MQYLNKGSLTRRGGRVQVVSLKIDLAERTSLITATVIGSTVPNLDDWLITDEGPIAGMVWCVRDTDDQHIGTGKYSFTAESVLTVLKGKILFGKTTAADITGNKKDINCTAKQAVQFALGKQAEKHFTLGTIEYTNKNPYHFNGETIFDALEDITASLPDACWDVDFSTYPFKLNIRKLSSSVESEMRWSRNIASPIKKTMSKNGMYTVFYPVGKNNLALPEKSMALNVSKYGTIEKTETDQSLETVEALRAWAEERLRKHAKPLATVTLTGIYLAEVTGEKLDRIKVNRICRVPIQGEELIEERVIKLTWPDWVKEPLNVSVTLCNQESDVASVIREMQKRGSGGRAGRTAAVNAEEDHAWFEDTTDHVSMVAMAIIGKNPEGVDWKRVSDLTVGENGIYGSVDALEGDMKRYGTKLQQNEKSIGMVVGTYPDGSNFVKAGEICMAINESGSAEAYINASKIYLLGQTIANTVTAELIQSKVNLMSNLRVKQLTVATALKFEGGDGCTITSSQAADILRNLRISRNGNNYTLQKITCGGGSWEDVGTFSRAITSWGVAGSSGKVKVTAQPQNQSKEVPVSISGGNTISANGQYLYDIYYEDDNGDDVKLPGTTKTITVAVHPNSMTLTRSKAGRTSGGLDVYYGQLYYWDDDDGSYMPAAAGNHYWYYSSTNRAGTNAVYY